MRKGYKKILLMLEVKKSNILRTTEKKKHKEDIVGNNPLTSSGKNQDQHSN